MPADPNKVDVVFQAAAAIANLFDRAVFLDRECGTDAELRRLVEARLQTPDPQQTGGFAPRIGPNIGSVFAGRYKLREKLGEGGMGEVWVADQSEPVQRRVALKIIKSNISTERLLARFEQERQALALMDHPNIAKVLDAGVADHTPYFVMELIKGVPLTKYCDDAKLTPRQRLELFIPVCQAVQHAHQKGIIHRDLKPSNIIIGLYDGRPVPKVIDFGVAKATGPKLTEQSVYTEVGSLIGTVEYMSPEQAELNNLDIDTRSDIYALGVILYELLTGSVPFSRKQLQSAGYAEMLRIIKEVEPQKPSTKLSGSGELPGVAAVRQMEPRKLTRLVRGELDWIVMKCLEKERSRRYETANGLAMDIQRYLSDEAVAACPPSAGYRLRKFARKHRKGLTVAAAFGVLLMIGAGVCAVLAVRATEAKDQASNERRKALEERDRAVAAESEATAVNDFFRKEVLAQASPDEQAGRGGSPDVNLKVKDVLDRASQRIAGRFEQQPLVEASIRLTIGMAYLDLARDAEGEKHLERAYDLFRKEVGEEHPRTLEALFGRAKVLHMRGKFVESMTVLAKLLESRRRVLGDEHADTLATCLMYARKLWLIGDGAQAEALLNDKLPVSRRVLGEDHQTTLGMLSVLAWLYQSRGRYAEGEALSLRVVDAMRRVHGESHPRTLRAIEELSFCYFDQGKFGQSELYLARVVELASRSLGEAHSTTLDLMTGLAKAYSALGKDSEAEKLHQKVLKLARESPLGEEHMETVSFMLHLAAFYLDHGRFDLAEPLVTRALRIYSRDLGEKEFFTLWAKERMADLYRVRGDHFQADSLYVTVLKGNWPINGTAEHTDMLASLSEVRLQQRKYVEAEPVLRECLSIHAQKTHDFWQQFHVRSLLGASLLGQKKYADAEPLLLSGYEGMKARAEFMPAYRKKELPAAVERLVRLYEATDKPDLAAKWFKVLYDEYAEKLPGPNEVVP